MNDEDKRKVKIGIYIAAFTVVLFFLLQNITKWQTAAGFLFSLVAPIVYGICFGFVLNIIMVFFENKVFKRLNKKPKWVKIRRPVCLSISVLLLVGILAALIAFLLPQLAESSASLFANIPSYISEIESMSNNLLNSLGFEHDIVTTVSDWFATFYDKIFTTITSYIPQIANTAMNVTSGVVNLFMGFVLGIYMVSMKETLISICKKIIYAVFSQRRADYLRHVYRLVNARFYGFVSGQVTEAFILGTLCFIGMKILGMEYALLVSVIIGTTNIIPMFGAWIGGAVGVLLMLMVDPVKALWFLIFLLILQQIESNLIYPRVVGNSIGLSGLWVLFAVIIGGSLFGFAGILLGVPSFAVIYTLLSEWINARLKAKKIKI